MPCHGFTCLRACMTVDSFGTVWLLLSYRFTLDGAQYGYGFSWLFLLVRLSHLSVDRDQDVAPAGLRHDGLAYRIEIRAVEDAGPGHHNHIDQGANQHDPDAERAQVPDDDGHHHAGRKRSSGHDQAADWPEPAWHQVEDNAKEQ